MASEESKAKKMNYKQPQNPSGLIRKLIHLMEHPISAEATERHLFVLNEFLYYSHYAFWLPDISYIILLYENLLKKLDTNPKFKEPFKCLLHFSAIPPMMTKSSDVMDHARDLQQYFSVLGNLILCIHDNELRKLVLDAIKNLLDPSPPAGWCCVPLDYCKQAVEESYLPELLTQALQFISNDLYSSLLDVIFMVCKISTVSCQKMVSQDAIEFLLLRLEPTWNERAPDVKPNNPSSKHNIPHLEDTCCILWKLLSVVEEDEKVKEPSEFALWSLQYAFRWSHIYPAQKINRNNITAIILKILVTFPKLDFSQSDLSDDILTIAITVAGCGCRSDLKFTESAIDFQFRKLVWFCLHFYQRERPFLVLCDHELVRGFLKYLFQEHSSDKNHIEQYCELAKLVLKTLPLFVESAVDCFLQLNGPSRIIGMISGYLTKTYDIELLEAYMFCLCKVLLLNIEIIIVMIGDTNTASFIIAICDKILQNAILTSTYQKVLGHGFCIIQILCDAGYLRNKEVIKLCINYLQRVINPNEYDPLIDNRVTVCAVDLLWNCILTSKSFYREFIKKCGIYALLDVMECSTFLVKTLTLGILADTAKKPTCVPYLITWRKHGHKLVPTLLEIFRNQINQECDDNEKTQLAKDKLDYTWLTKSQKQRIYFQNNCAPTDELIKKCRYRIYGILNALKVQFKDVVEIANEHYKLFSEKLCVTDELTMVFAENFSSLNMCDTWLKIWKELRKEGTVPTENDTNQLKEKVQGIRQWKSYLQFAISHIVEKELQQERFHELETYTVLKEARLSDALDALRELHYISNCTERMFQMRQKLKLQQEVDTLRANYANFHRTICDLPFTNLYNQNISIQSNIIYEKKEEQQCPLTPVSLDENIPLLLSDSDHDLSEHILSCDL